MKSIKKEVYNFQEYVWNNRWHILIATILLISVYGIWMYNINPRIDAEVLINTPYSTYNYLDSGRQGNVLTEIVFGMRWFNPLFVTCTGILMFALAGIMFGFLCCRVGVKSNISTWFGLICFTCPIMVEMIYFDMLIFKAAWAYILCMLVTAMILDMARRHSKVECLIAIFCLIWVISTYEVFVAVYIASVVFCFIMLYNKWTVSEENYNKEKIYIRIIVLSVSVLLIALIVNTIITNVFFSSGIGYVYGQFQWNQQPIKSCLTRIAANIVEGLCGIGVFYSAFMGITALLVVLNIMMHVRRCKGAKLRWLYVLAGIGLQICPFLLTIFLGGVPVYRAQLAYPVVITFNLLFLISQEVKQKWIQYAYLIIMAFTIWSQTQTTMRLEYTDLIRTQEDMRLFSQIEDRVGVINTKHKPVAFVGQYNNKLNNACLRGSLIGLSIFSHDAQNPPIYLNSSIRACCVGKMWGFDFEAVNSAEDMEMARRIALDMPSWPSENSVYDAGEFIIVKLSEDDYAADIMEPGINKLYNMSEIENDEKLSVAIDEVSIVDEILEIKGWVIKENEDTTNTKKQVVLYDENNNYYEINTYKTARPDVVEYYDNELYNYSGYVSKVYIEQLPNNYNHLKIAMKYQLENDDVVYYKSDYDIASLLFKE